MVNVLAATTGSKRFSNLIIIKDFNVKSDQTDLAYMKWSICNQEFKFEADNRPQNDLQMVDQWYSLTLFSFGCHFNFAFAKFILNLWL